MLKEYARLFTIANEMEAIRLKLFCSDEHRDSFLSEKDFAEFNEELWKLQSRVRELAAPFIED